MKHKHTFAYTKILIIVYLFSFTISLFAIDKVEQIDQFVQLYHDYGQFNGTVLVAEGGKIIFKKGYGMANMEWSIPNEPDTKFRLGSITKQFSSMLIMQLVEQGKIKLDAKITEYLPDYRKDTGDKITVHHLLTHTSGVPNFTNLPDYREISRDPFPVDEFMAKYCSGDLEFEPGTKYSYSNSGYFILGVIIEKVTGKKFEDVLQEKILDPLNMKNTGYDHHAVIIPHRASGYQKTFDGFENADYLDMSLPYAAGALYSTVEDLFLWDRALYTDKLLANKYKKMMFTPFLNNYAYGWGVGKMSLADSKDSLKYIRHGGGINGFNTLILRLIEDQHLIVLFNNTGGTNLNAIGNGIVNILYNKPYEPPKKNLAQALFKEIMNKNIESAIKQYHELKDKHAADYDFSEGVLNQLGYQLLGVRKIPAAIEIFKLNVEMFPEASNVYDSLGEAYMENGEKELAIKNYAKSLELNPDNRNAIIMLNRIAGNK